MAITSSGFLIFSTLKNSGATNIHVHVGWYGWARIAMAWTVQGLNSIGGVIFCACQDGPWGPPSLLYNRYWVSFKEVQWLGRGINHPPPSSTKGKERVDIYLYSPSGPSWSVLWWAVYGVVCLYAL
jgi:hypothetical protein